MTTPRLVFLHGFTQTHHHWHAAAHLLAARVDSSTTLAFVDLPGHGLAADDRDGELDTIAPRLLRLAGRGTYVGYSMGGRIALAAAATGDPRVERLVVLGATAGIEDPAERAERRRLDATRARHVEDIGVEAFVDEWTAMPMFARLPDDAAALAHRRANTAAGLAHSLRAFGTGVQTPVWDALSSIRIPVLVLAGALDAKFAELGARMAALLPHGTFAAVPGAGHAAHTERPVATVDRIAAWIEEERLPNGQPSASPTASSSP